MKNGAKSPGEGIADFRKRRARRDSGEPLQTGLLAVISPKLAAAKAAAKLAGMLIAAKLRANFRKWNRGDYGKRDHEA